MANYTQNDIDSLRAMLTEYLTRCKGRKIVKNMTNCINPDHPDKNPSMRVKNNRCECYGCGFDGSIFDAVALDENMDIKTEFPQIVKRTAEIMGYTLTSQGEENKAWKEKSLGEYKFTKDLEKIYKSVKTTHFHYQDADGNTCYTVYRGDFYPPDENGNTKTFRIGVEDENGALTYFDKLEDIGTAREKLGIANRTDFEHIALYGDFRNYKPGETVYIVEGEKCVFSLKAKGFSNVITSGSSSTVSTWRAAKYKDEIYKIFHNTNVVILADSGVVGGEYANGIKEVLESTCNMITIIVPYDIRDNSDVADFFDNGGTVEQLKEIIDNTPPSFAKDNTYQVKELLDYTIQYEKNAKGEYKTDENGDKIVKSKKVKNTVRNWRTVLQNDVRTLKRIAYNEFMGRIWDKKTDASWESKTDSTIYDFVQCEYELGNRQDRDDAIIIEAHDHKFHPIRQRLDLLPYDRKTDYIGSMLTDYLGAEPTPYNAAVFENFMVAAVARVYSPGIKFDTCMVLQSEKQGLGKSYFLRKLAIDESWFTDNIGSSFDNDETKRGIQGKWIIELSELQSLMRSSSEATKQFISCQVDNIRLPYERNYSDFPRQCVFAGTTNKTDFLRDNTGNRRWLIVECDVVDIKKDVFSEEMEIDVLNAWGQAVYLYKQKLSQARGIAKRVNLDLPLQFKREAEEKQENYIADDGKRDIIAAYLEDKDKTCVTDIWKNALEEKGLPSVSKASEIRDIICRLPGWARSKKAQRFSKELGGVQKGFVKNITEMEFQDIPDDETTPFDSVTTK